MGFWVIIFKCYKKEHTQKRFQTTTDLLKPIHKIIIKIKWQEECEERHVGVLDVTQDASSEGDAV